MLPRQGNYFSARSHADKALWLAGGCLRWLRDLRGAGPGQLSDRRLRKGAGSEGGEGTRVGASKSCPAVCEVLRFPVSLAALKRSGVSQPSPVARRPGAASPATAAAAAAAASPLSPAGPGCSPRPPPGRGAPLLASASYAERARP